MIDDPSLVSDAVSLKQVTFEGESYYQISNQDQMEPFLMSIVSDSNHWMFISSNGGLTAGRKNSDHALFPYYTDDKLIESHDRTGSKSIFWITKNGQSVLWEPFTSRHGRHFKYSRNLYKNTLGNKIIFEEVNHELEVSFKYQWSSSNNFGFVRRSFLINNSHDELTVRLVDGIQNVMPHGVGMDLQATRSNLVNAYKRSELEVESGVGIYALSAIIVDRAEPSEALKANVVWSGGISSATHLLSSEQLNAFRNGEEMKGEVDVKARNGAYFISTELPLTALEEKSWYLVANINQGPSTIPLIVHKILNQEDLDEEVLKDVEEGSQRLRELVYSADGLQLTDDKKGNTRHYSNTLFNIMRGGVFDNNYLIEKADFEAYLSKANYALANKFDQVISALPSVFTLQSLTKLAKENSDLDFGRLAMEYLPLKFSRRHGDPSRPWNKFSINTRNEEDGSKVLDYEGNWRDIFQNWEALAHSYPDFIDGMIFKFLNASTFDGYNPYRVTKDGFDWEVIEAHDPWSYIGYWGDHQIIYLLKFLEFAESYYPGKLENLFDQNLFVYANVPYKIKSYKETLSNPKDTIQFDSELDRIIRQRRSEIGADGSLLFDQNNQVYKVNFIEKILVTILAKVSNFIPEGGIWMNTQRPEWNDANNALVGNGVSMVTLFYLRRFLSFFKRIIVSSSQEKSVSISKEVLEFYRNVYETLLSNRSFLNGEISSKKRKAVLDELGGAGSKYRWHIYSESFSNEKEEVSIDNILFFIDLVLDYLDHSIKANKRLDGMYHAYNLMTLENEEGITIDTLDEMLEGQVAVLSSGYLSSAECLELLDAIKASRLFREDQYSYLLYPNRDLPGFLKKNIIPNQEIGTSGLLQYLLEKGNTEIIEKDVNGVCHFNGNFKNANDLSKALNELKVESALIEKEKDRVLELFENVFNHKAFTGRSGTFFGYEGLGSIYWHMVSKLALAVEECCLDAINQNANKELIGRLLEHYYEISEGIGIHKSPLLYGAFSMDPYSHTPLGKGAQQPGMTGQVKEDIICRIKELGLIVSDGQIQFNPCLLRDDEFLSKPKTFDYLDVNRNAKSISLVENTLAYTYCQVPIIYSIAEEDGLEIHFSDDDSSFSNELKLNAMTSQQVFRRTGKVESIKVYVKRGQLK